MTELVKYMISELSQYRRDKSELMEEYVSNRLNESFSQYDKELKQSIEYLTYKHEKSLIKRMKK